MDEIERKFLVKHPPDLSGIQAISYKRYYLYAGNGIELRVQQRGNEYELERKVTTGKLSRSNNICPISVDEFDLLKKLSNKLIRRDSYQLNETPNASIKIYHGDYEGLVRAEFEFDSEAEAQSFIPPDWCGVEITDSELGRDSRLVTLTKEDFQKEFKKWIK